MEEDDEVRARLDNLEAAVAELSSSLRLLWQTCGLCSRRQRPMDLVSNPVEIRLQPEHRRLEAPKALGRVGTVLANLGRRFAFGHPLDHVRRPTDADGYLLEAPSPRS